MADAMDAVGIIYDQGIHSDTEGHNHGASDLPANL